MSIDPISELRRLVASQVYKVEAIPELKKRGVHRHLQRALREIDMEIASRHQPDPDNAG